MTDTNIFEQASKLTIRFASSKGLTTTEDLWNFPLTSERHSSLDSVAKGINKALKESSEESFVAESTKANSVLELKLEIVKHIIKCKKEQLALKANSVKAKALDERILAILADKQDDDLKSKSIAELTKMRADLKQ